MADIKVTLGGGGLAGSGGAITLKNIAGSSGTTTLPGLTDVDTTGQVNNAILIFNTATDQYEIKPLNNFVLTNDFLTTALANNVSINGGTF